MREDYYVDPQGRNVRAKHVARYGSGKQQLILWDDIRTAPQNHMQIAFTQRREQIVGDCRQLKRDVDSYNDNNAEGSEIQLVFNFENDLAEIEAEERANRKIVA